MAVAFLGVALSGYGLMPRMAQMRRTLHGHGQVHFHLADGVALNREHWKLVAVLVVALAVDVMKPATLGFVVPGMSREYAITKPTASLLALVIRDEGGAFQPDPECFLERAVEPLGAELTANTTTTSSTLSTGPRVGARW